MPRLCRQIKRLPVSWWWQRPPLSFLAVPPRMTTPPRAASHVVERRTPLRSVAHAARPHVPFRVQMLRIHMRQRQQAAGGVGEHRTPASREHALRRRALALMAARKQRPIPNLAEWAAAGAHRTPGCMGVARGERKKIPNRTGSAWRLATGPIAHRGDAPAAIMVAAETARPAAVLLQSAAAAGMVRWLEASLQVRQRRGKSRSIHSAGGAGEQAARVMSTLF